MKYDLVKILFLLEVIRNIRIFKKFKVKEVVFVWYDFSGLNLFFLEVCELWERFFFLCG